MLSIYEGRMIVRLPHRQPSPRSAAVIALFALGIGVGGCANMSDSMSAGFADPAKYELYECKQLEAERKSLAARTADVQGLMAKAETGAAGSVVSELAYRNDYISVRGQQKFAEEAWRSNKCQESPPGKTDAPDRPSANVKPAPRPRSGGAVY